MTRSSFAWLLSGVLLNACAQLLLKAGVRPLGAVTPQLDTLWATAVQLASQWPILAALACYGLSVGVWIVGLSRVDVSVAYPMLSLGYVVNALAAALLFGEPLGPARIAGIGLILLGVFVVARS